MKKVLILVLIFNFILVQAQDKVVTKNGKEIEVNNDASTTSKGIVKLAGDLGGTADSPTVPGLATKQNTLTLTTTGTGAATLTGATLNIPTPTFGTPFSLLGTSTEAGNDKTSGIWRTGGLFTGGSSTATLFGNLSTIGGTNFSGGFPKGLASIGLISNSTAGWTGSGFLFSNSVTGNNAFTATINNDKIYQAWLTPANTYTMTSIANSLGWGFGTNVPTGYSPTYGLEAVTTFKIGTLPTITNATEVLVPDPTTAQVSKQTIANIRNTPWFTAGTTTDAGGDKTNAIYRNGSTLIATGTTTQTTPLKSFHLQAGGASNLTSAFGSGQIFSTNDGSGARFFLEHTTSNVNEKTSVIYNQSGLTYLGAIVSDNGGSWIYGAPLVVKHSNGFVGFNQTTPSYQADINGTARIATLPAITTATEVMVPDPSTGQVSKQTIANIRNTPWFTAGTTTDAGGDKAGDIYRTGKIGIGATSPLTNPISRVEIIQNSLFSGTETSTHGMQIISGKTVGTDITLYMGADNTNANSYLQSVKWGTTTAPLVLNGRGGNVGIGTPTPANKLEITHGTAGNSGLRFTNLNSSSAATTSASKVLALNSTGDVILTNVPGTQNIVSFSTATPTTSGVVFTPNTPADQTVIYQSATDNSMWTYNGTVYNTYTAPSSTAWNLANTTNDAGSTKTSSIWRTGNIGIGTNNPTNNLDVVGGFHLRNTSGAAGSNYGIELNTNSNAPRIDWVFNGSYIGQFSSDANNFLLQNSKTSTGGFRFTTNPGSGALDRLNILNNGNV
ncbi:beta strand repeat-containing protein, partial [Flavobacterium sp.]|uniref:beta strand repeat-containing protein n=1 Tax=Flavobacterium sp. TaxID=239 RepID=UPI00345D4075